METVKKNTEISMRDMFFYLIQRWRALIICIICGALILGFYGWFSSNSRVIDMNDASQVESTMTIDERKAARTLAGCIADYEIRIENLREYIGTSSFMRLDPYNVVKSQVKFFVGHDTTTEDEGMNTARVQYYESLVSSAKLTELDMAFGDNVTVDTTSQNLGFFTVEVRCADRQTAEKASEELTYIVLDGNSGAREATGKHDITVVSYGVYTGYDGYVLERQAATGELLDNYTEQLEKEREQISQDQQAYINYLISEYKKGQSGADAEPEKDNGSTARFVRKKYIALGAFVGLILALIVIVIKYISEGKVHTGDDISKAYRTSVIGTFEGNSRFHKKHGTRLDRFFRRKRLRIKAETNEEIIATAARIGAISGKNGSSGTCLIIGEGVQDEATFAEIISKELEKVTNVAVIRNITSDKNAITGLASYQSAVFVEQMDCSRYRDMDSEISICRKLGLDIIGAILID